MTGISGLPLTVSEMAWVGQDATQVRKAACALDGTVSLPEVEDLLLAVDAAGVDAAKCALVDDWEGVYRDRAIIRVLQAQLAKREAADG